MKSKNSETIKNVEKEATNAFVTNVEYFEHMREHHNPAGKFDANIEEDVKSLILENLRGNVLDAGGGEGSISVWIARGNPDAQIYCVDISPIGVRMGRVLNEKANINNAEFLTGDLRKLPFSDDTFDLIVCQSVLEHVIGVFDVLKEFYRILKEGGKLIIRVGNEESLLNFSFLGWILRNDKEKLKRPSFTLRLGSVKNHRENFDTCSISSYILINQLKKLRFSVQFYTTFPEYVLQSDFKDLSIIKRMAMKLLLKLHRFPPICHMGGTTIVMVRKG